MLVYRFKINDTIVEEPTSWDGEEFVLARSKEYFGFENSYSLTLKFWNNGAAIIKTAYDVQGIEAMLDFVVEKSCDGVAFTPIISGILNCATYSELNGEVSVMLEESSFQRTFKNRIDNEVNLYSTTTIDGQELSTINPIDVTLQSKTIKQFSTIKQNSALLSINASSNYTIETENNFLFFPLQIEVNDLKNVNEVLTFFHLKAPPLRDFATPIFINAFTGLESNITVSYQLQGNFIHETVDSTRYIYSIFFSYGSFADENVTYIVSPTLYENAQNIPINLSGSFLIPGSTEKVWLTIAFVNYQNLNTSSPSASFFTLNSNSENFVKFNSDTEFAPTTSKVFPLFSALEKVLEITTGVPDALRSDFFNDSGCGGLMSITNGLALRNMLQKDLTPFPINVSFSKLYKILDSIYCIGMNIEWDLEDEKWVVRIEPRSYFYAKTHILTFDNVSDITIKANLNHYFSEIAIGYQKWQLNNGQLNGIDEFNTPRSYSIRNKNAKNKLEKKCDAIAGGYPIEFTRRQQYSIETTKDFETDNDLFIICLNRVVQGEYAIGTTNERDELFPTVLNLISPETAYNLRISPARNMVRWLRYIKISCAKVDKFIKFSTSEGNALMKSTSISSCDITVQIDEHANFETGVNGFSQANNELFEPQTISFEKPFDFATFAQLQGNSKVPVRINTKCGKVFKAFLESVKFKPNGKDGGSAEFEFTTAPKTGGSFSSGFSEGFEIS